MTGLIDWIDGARPRSRRFGDVYFSAGDGLAESQAVFLAGCGLPDAWRGRRSFCVAELGFGSGLNIAALLELWSRQRPVGGHLSIFSVEAFPLQAADAAKALASWPQLAPIAQALTDRWPARTRGFHRLDLPHLAATLDLAVMEVEEALSAWSGKADAWFLDGFAPALNPEMWRQRVLDLVAARSAAGARLGTYTVAGEVRRGLAATGCAVERAPGFGGKRHRLQGRWPGERAREAAQPRVAIVGAGIAGVSLARAFAALGVAPRLIAGRQPPASAARAALVTPRLDAGLGAQAALFAQAYARARDLYSAWPEAIISRGALQLAIGPKDGRRFEAIAASDLFEFGQMTPVGAEETSRRLGEAAPMGLAIAEALVVNPEPLLAMESVAAEVASLEQAHGVWRLLDAAGGVLVDAEIVVIAAGMDSARLIPGLPLRPVRGQASFAAGVRISQAALFGAYAAPTEDGVVFGATHDRDDTDLETRAQDHERNLAAVAAVLPELARRLGAVTLEARVGVRATTSDYLPLAGAAGPGLFILSGLGSRGFTLAPLLAEHVAALALDRPSPLPAPLSAIVDPARFASRRARRGRPRAKPVWTESAKRG